MFCILFVSYFCVILSTSANFVVGSWAVSLYVHEQEFNWIIIIIITIVIIIITLFVYFSALWFSSTACL
jgi:hypothetical protein